MATTGSERRSTSDNGLKVVIVRPLSARREAVALACLLGLILALMAGRFYSVRKKGLDASHLEPYQQKDLFLKNQAPIMYRSLCSVAGDILDIFQDEGSWPSVKRLEEEELPPFAKDFLPPGLKGYVWKMYPGQGWVDYFGINKDVGKKARAGFDPLKDSFVLRIIDLRGAARPPGPYVENKTDQGKRFTWQVWIYPAPRDYPGAQKLIDKGWKWIVNSNNRS